MQSKYSGQKSVMELVVTVIFCSIYWQTLNVYLSHHPSVSCHLQRPCCVHLSVLYYFNVKTSYLKKNPGISALVRWGANRLANEPFWYSCPRLTVKLTLLSFAKGKRHTYMSTWVRRKCWRPSSRFHRAQVKWRPKSRKMLWLISPRGC